MRTVADGGLSPALKTDIFPFSAVVQVRRCVNI